MRAMPREEAVVCFEVQGPRRAWVKKEHGYDLRERTPRHRGLLERFGQDASFLHGRFQSVYGEGWFTTSAATGDDVFCVERAPLVAPGDPEAAVARAPEPPGGLKPGVKAASLHCRDRLADLDREKPYEHDECKDSFAVVPASDVRAETEEVVVLDGEYYGMVGVWNEGGGIYQLFSDVHDLCADFVQKVHQTSLADDAVRCRRGQALRASPRGPVVAFVGPEGSGRAAEREKQGLEEFGPDFFRKHLRVQLEEQHLTLPGLPRPEPFQEHLAALAARANSIVPFLGAKIVWAMLTSKTMPRHELFSDLAEATAEDGFKALLKESGREFAECLTSLGPEHPLLREGEEGKIELRVRFVWRPLDECRDRIKARACCGCWSGAVPMSASWVREALRDAEETLQNPKLWGGQLVILGEEVVDVSRLKESWTIEEVGACRELHKFLSSKHYWYEHCGMYVMRDVGGEWRVLRISLQNPFAARTAVLIGNYALPLFSGGCLPGDTLETCESQAMMRACLR